MAQIRNEPVFGQTWHLEQNQIALIGGRYHPPTARPTGRVDNRIGPVPDDVAVGDE